MQEIWLPVLGYEGLYEVSNMGKVRSLDRIVPDKTHGTRKLNGKFLAQTVDEFGRKSVVFSKHSITLKKRVHLIVAAHFLGPNVSGLEVCHNDGNNSNNCVTNLRYDTHKSNMEDMADHGKSQRGEKNYNATTKLEQAKQIIGLRKQGLIYKDIAAKVGVSFTVAAKICSGHRWKWIS
jgi:hypothetical protein